MEGRRGRRGGRGRRGREGGWDEVEGEGGIGRERKKKESEIDLNGKKVLIKREGEGVTKTILF